MLSTFTKMSVQEQEKFSHTLQVDYISFFKMWRIFGGRDNFLKLQVIDLDAIPNVYSPENSLNIPASSMTAPIMRGVDKDNREFFVIRFEKIDKAGNKAQKLFVQYFRLLQLEANMAGLPKETN